MGIKLTDVRQTKEVELPSFKGSKIEIYSSLLVKDLGTSDIVEKSDVHTVVKQLPSLIKSWNFEDDAGKTLPVNVENIEKIPVSDLTFLMKEIASFSTEEKKS